MEGYEGGLQKMQKMAHLPCASFICNQLSPLSSLLQSFVTYLSYHPYYQSRDPERQREAKRNIRQQKTEDRMLDEKGNNEFHIIVSFGGRASLCTTKERAGRQIQISM